MAQVGIAKWLPNIGLVAASIVVAALIAEAATRFADDLPVLTDWLPNTTHRDARSAELDSIPRAPGVSRDWFFRDPPPLPNRIKLPADWERIAEEIKQHPAWVMGSIFAPADFFKAWNAARYPEPCTNPILRQAPGRLFVYAPADGAPYPRFRFLPNATTPLGLVTNAFGWRGRPIEFAKAPNVVRIAFVGASTTVNSHDYPFSYPELIGGWLDLWAASRGLGVTFEILNAGREGIDSTNIEAIVRNEVLPLQPELVVYYEGGSTFIAQQMVTDNPVPPSSTPDAEESRAGFPAFMRSMASRSAILRRVHMLLEVMEGRGAEWPKPDYQLAWPPDLDEADPDFTRQDLPVRLPTIVRDLGRIRASVAQTGSELAISSYKWLAHDGLIVDPVRNRALLEQLNITLYPLTYRDIDRAASLHNRVLAKFAAVHGLPFLDVARLMPEDPDLYTDWVHFSYAGVRLHAWIVMQGLVPLIERKLSTGAWPRPMPSDQRPPPGLLFAPKEIAVSCSG